MGLDTFIHYTLIVIGALTVVRFGWLAIQRLTGKLSPIIFKKAIYARAATRNSREEHLALLTLQMIKDDIEEDRTNKS